MSESNMGRSLVPAGEPPAEDENRETPRQPRQPADLQGLLRFAMEATRSEDSHRETPLQSLDDERRKFLEDAIDSLSVDITKELRENINLLSDKDVISKISVDSGVPSEILQAFENIEDHVMLIDVAIGFYKLGGFSIFPVCLSCEHPFVRTAACNLLGELCQNNPFCQTKVLECGYLNTLIQMLMTEQDNLLLSRIFYGISCITRQHDPCIRTFFQGGGIKGLVKLLNMENNEKVDLHKRVAFFIRCIYPENTHITNELVSSGFVKALIHALPEERNMVSEQILAALHILATSNDPVIRNEVIKPEYNLHKKLKIHIESDELKCENTDLVEERQYCDILLKIIKDGNPITDENINRTGVSENTKSEVNIDR